MLRLLSNMKFVKKNGAPFTKSVKRKIVVNLKFKSSMSNKCQWYDLVFMYYQVNVSFHATCKYIQPQSHWTHYYTLLEIVLLKSLYILVYWLHFWVECQKLLWWFRISTQWNGIWFGWHDKNSTCHSTT